MFFDEVSLELAGGPGGSGMVSFHREKFVAHGPPDGGDGGKGGSVVLVADANYNTFRHFAGRKSFMADKGQDGHKNNMTGRGGEDFELKVPIGTLVYDEGLGEQIADLKANGMKFVVAGGGRGGHGNANFSSSVRQAPQFAELGDIGEKRAVRLEMQLVADIGLVGFPSAGKSTLISHVSAAKPKIGDYPFTTLVPNLGVVNLAEFGGGEEQSFVIADMPGIIEGASEGKGLGDTFLKHISRSATLVYLLDPFSYDDRTIVEQFKVLQGELGKYKKELLDKDQIVVMNKIDAIPEEDRAELKATFVKEFPDWEDRFRMGSGVSGEGLEDLMKELWNLVQSKKEEVPEIDEGDREEYAPKYFVDDQSFEVEKMYDLKPGEFEERVWGQLIADDKIEKRQLFVVTGARIEQISRMSNLDHEGSLQRVYDVMKKMGIHDELRKAGAETGDYVKIEPHFYEFHDLSSE
jgi:GTPase